MFTEFLFFSSWSLYTWYLAFSKSRMTAAMLNTATVGRTAVLAAGGAPGPGGGARAGG